LTVSTVVEHIFCWLLFFFIIIFLWWSQQWLHYVWCKSIIVTIKLVFENSGPMITIPYLKKNKSSSTLHVRSTARRLNVYCNSVHWCLFPYVLYKLFLASKILKYTSSKNNSIDFVYGNTGPLAPLHIYIQKYILLQRSCNKHFM